MLGEPLCSELWEDFVEVVMLLGAPPIPLGPPITPPEMEVIERRFSTSGVEPGKKWDSVVPGLSVPA